jgi:hypothetical protein
VVPVSFEDAGRESYQVSVRPYLESVTYPVASDSEWRVAKHQSFPSRFSVYKSSLSPSLLLFTISYNIHTVLPLSTIATESSYPLREK